MKIKSIINGLFSCPHFVLAALGGISVAALVAALISQYGFGMQPCELCLYQRIPFAVVILLSVLGLVALKVMGKQYAVFNIVLCVFIVFLEKYYYDLVLLLFCLYMFCFKFIFKHWF